MTEQANTAQLLQALEVLPDWIATSKWIRVLCTAIAVVMYWSLTLVPPILEAAYISRAGNVQPICYATALVLTFVICLGIAACYVRQILSTRRLGFSYFVLGVLTLKISLQGVIAVIALPFALQGGSRFSTSLTV
jgi:hypothetical protein